MRLCEFTKPGDYAPIAKETNDAPRQLERNLEGCLLRNPKKGGGGGDGAHQRETMITQ